MIRTILAAILIFAAFILFVLVIVFIKIFISPSFNSLGEINECVGCNGCTYKDGENYIHIQRKGCKYNPDYWDGYKYKGPSYRELKRLAKED
ncbi:hypothetical protein AALB81_12395 [Lachnospiraceae bacterium 48-33]